MNLKTVKVGTLLIIDKFIIACRATATGAPAYQAAQTGYAVAPTAAAAATYTTQRAAPAYDTAYPTAATHTTPGTYAGTFSFLKASQVACLSFWLNYKLALPLNN